MTDDSVSSHKIDVEVCNYSSRADPIFNTSYVPTDDPTPSTAVPQDVSDYSAIEATGMGVRKPIAGDTNDKSNLKNSSKIGKKTLLDFLLPPKQQIPSTTEGKHIL